MKKEGKNFKIWGMSFSPLGDLIYGLPLLTYFEKKHPNSYKYWVIKKSCAFAAPIFFNHPLIDCIKITDNWKTYGDTDKQLMSQCDIVISEDFEHDRLDWYNYRSVIEETAYISGIRDFEDVLTIEERKPKLVKWFDVGHELQPNTWSKDYISDLSFYENTIGIWPFPTGFKTHTGRRSPRIEWWAEFIKREKENNLKILHYGRDDEPVISTEENYIRMTKLSFFDQIRSCLATNLVIGTDSGPMCIMGAYQHKAIHLISNYLVNHNDNLFAFKPINDNSVTLLGQRGVENISVDALIKIVKDGEL